MREGECEWRGLVKVMVRIILCCPLATIYCSLLSELVEGEEDYQAEAGVDQCAAEEIQDVERRRGVEKQAMHHGEKYAVDQYQSGHEAQPGEHVLEFEFDAGRGGKIPNQPLGHAEHADQAAGKRVLQKADPGAQSDGEDFVAPDDGEINGDQQWKIKKPCQRNPDGKERLQQERREYYYPEQRRVHPKRGCRFLNCARHRRGRVAEAHRLG